MDGLSKTCKGARVKSDKKTLSHNSIKKGLALCQPMGIIRPASPQGGALSGRSSVVEHNLAKVGVEGSNLFARSILPRFFLGECNPVHPFWETGFFVSEFH